MLKRAGSCLENTRFIKVHNYIVSSVIAKGAFSTVRRCFKKGSSKEYVMKVIQRQRLCETQGGRSIMFNERCLMPLLNHPHILKVHEVIESARQLLVVTRACQNSDLLSYLSKEDVGFEVGLSVIDQILSAVEYLHSRQICHRDIKLENVLVDDHNRVFLADLGLASISLQGTVTGKRGSLAYLAPEACSGAPFDGFKAEVFSCGALFYAILTRNMAFDGIEGRREPDFSAISDVQMRDLIRRMLADSPDDRPSIAECRRCRVFDCVADRCKTVAMVEHRTYDDSWIVSRLSQMLDVQVDWVHERLSAPEMNREKLLYTLFQEKMVRLSLASDHFEEISECRSCPRAFAPPAVMQTFTTTSVQVLKAMKRFLKPINGCITAPNATNKSRFIVVNHVETDEVIEFELRDVREANTDVTMLSIGSSNSLHLVDEMVGFVKERLATACHLPIPTLNLCQEVLA